MANILYGVAGEGMGHATRSKEIITYLLSKGHQVKIVSHDQGYDSLKDIFDVEKIWGLKIWRKNYQVQYISTFFKNFKNAPDAAKSVLKIRKIINDNNIQIVFTDFEPVSGIVANMKGIPVIAIDDQHRITRTKIDYPSTYRIPANLAKIIVNMDKMILPKAYLITNFFETEVKNNKKTFVFPPIIRREVLKSQPEAGNYILAYVHPTSSKMVEIFPNIDKNFIVYGLDKDETVGNIQYKKASMDGFLNDLVNCEAIISNAGFSLMTEALYLKKPFFAVPLKKQFDQLINAHYLEKLGYGKSSEDVKQSQIEEFLENLGVYRLNLEKYKGEDNTRIFMKIDELIEEYT